MVELLYDIDLEWLRRWNDGVPGYEQNGANGVRWRHSYEMDGGVGKRVAYEMFVWCGDSLKKWLEVRPSTIKKGFGVFATVRFEKGDIITARVEGQEYKDNGTEEPQIDNLQFGWQWIARKRGDDCKSNAVYVKENNLVRAKNRILAGAEIVLEDADSGSTGGAEYLDSIVFDEADIQRGPKSWHGLSNIGKVISGDSYNGFVVYYQEKRLKVKMSEGMVKALLVEDTRVDNGKRALKRAKINDMIG